MVSAECTGFPPPQCSVAMTVPPRDSFNLPQSMPGGRGVLLSAEDGGESRISLDGALRTGVQPIEHDSRTRCHPHQIGRRLPKPFARYRQVLGERRVKA
jgi:hypothetical protein